MFDGFGSRLAKLICVRAVILGVRYSFHWRHNSAAEHAELRNGAIEQDVATKRSH